MTRKGLGTFKVSLMTTYPRAFWVVAKTWRSSTKSALVEADLPTKRQDMFSHSPQTSQKGSLQSTHDSVTGAAVSTSVIIFSLLMYSANEPGVFTGGVEGLGGTFWPHLGQSFA
jgi:hypothetical protein